MVAWLSLVLALVTGCSDDASTDAMVPDAMVPDVSRPTVEVDPPTPPTAVTIPTPSCPSGWRSVMRGERTYCDPWPETGRAECSRGEVHFPGEAGCARIGPPCPSGDFPDDLPPTALPISYVRPGATGGDGSRAAPFGTPLEATRAAVGPFMMVLAKGTYDILPQLDDGSLVVGACVAETVVTTGDLYTGTIVVYSGTTEVRNLSIIDSGTYGLTVSGDDARLVVENVQIVSASGAGVLVADGGSLTARSLHVSRSQPKPRDEIDGGGIVAATGAHVELTRTVVDGGRLFGLTVGYAADDERRPTEIIANDTAIVGVAAQSVTVGPAFGVLVGSTGRFQATNLAIERIEGVGMLVVEGTASVASVLMREMLDPIWGRALDAQSADTVLQDAWMMDLLGGGITVSDGGSFDMRASFLDGVRTETGDSRGHGVYLGAGTTTTLREVGVRDTETFALRATAATLDASDLSLDAVRVSSGGASEAGLVLDEGTAASISRVEIDDTVTAGIVVLGSALDLRDGRVRGVRFVDGRHGYGVVVEGERSRLEGMRVAISDIDSAGLVVTDGSATLTDVDVSAIGGMDGVRPAGRGILTQRAATLTLMRGRVSETRLAGVMATGRSSVDFSHLSVVESRARTCSTTTCASDPYGIGLAAFDAALDGADFVVDGADLCGLMIDGDAATMTLMAGAVRNALIGACVSREDFDLAQIQTTVSYEDNGTNLDAPTPPVPPAADEARIGEAPDEDPEVGPIGS